MNFSTGYTLFALKFLFLAFVVLAFWPPFSFAFVTLACLGMFMTSMSIKGVVKKEPELFKNWGLAAVGFLTCFIVLVALI